MAITNFDIYATRLRDEKLDAKLKYTIALELCESLEFFQSQDYARFVAILWPVIRDLLIKNPPVFLSSAPEQKLRATLLEIIQRIPHSEVFRPIVLEVVTALLSLVKNENEENAVVCLKIIYELHRLYRASLESIAAPFLELAVDIYRDADQMLKAMESMETSSSLSTPNVSLMSPSAMSPGPDLGDVAMKNLNKATSSFKVLTEIPIIVVSIIQANRRYADPFVSNILPLILHMLELNPKATLAHESSQQQHGSGAMAAMQHHWRNSHADLITAQSKTLSFLAFFARGFTGLLLPNQDRIAQLTLQLLCVCPAEATATRKEMLIATRHIVSTEIRKAFVPIADRFLDMQVLVGSGLASQCILKPFAFSMLADLMHHIRADLSPSQLTKMVAFYAGCMHDQSLSSGVHTMCAKLLHNITECIMHIPDKTHGRVLLLSILKTFVASFSAIGCQASAAIKDIKDGGTHSEEVLYGPAELIRTSAFEQGEKAKELRFLLRSLVTGCKNVIYALKRCDSMLALGMGPRAQAITSEAEKATPAEANGSADVATSLVSSRESELVGFELDLLSSLFREGLRACRIHDVERIKNEHAAASNSRPSSSSSSSNGAANDASAKSAASGPAAKPAPHALSREAQIKLIDREGKEQIEHFANLFVSLDPAVFHELFTSQFEYAFESMIEHCAAIASVQVFVACEPTSPAFMSIMLRFLCGRLELLGSDDEALTSTMLHLFKIAFLALTFFPEANEPVLQPYVQTIINSALTISKTAKRPENYFLLLRALFRSIGGGRYESLYKEVFPVLQNLLETLNGALGFAKHASPMQELFVEICLTVPVRLSVLLPYLSLLMKPLVFALESGPELVSQGLRTLELCIDNLTREFLDPILTPVMDEIMASLWLHLRLPSSASTHAPVAARILGKLGGRNRHMLLTRFPADASDRVDPAEDRFSVPLTFEGMPGLVEMPLMDAIVFSTRVLEGRVAAKQIELARKDAVEFVVSCAKYALVLPFVGKRQVDEVLADAAEYGSQLSGLHANPISLKRLANISSPSLQGSQILEKVILSNSLVGNPELDIDAGKEAAAMTSASLSELCSGPPADGAIPVSRGGLIHIVWSLSLACAHSDEARGLLRTVISLGAMQHIIQCTETVKPEAAARKHAGLHTNMLGSIVPEAISRVLVSDSEQLRETGCLMLQFFYSALHRFLSGKAALVGQLPAMRGIVAELCSACYSPSVGTKRSGCAGIAFIARELDLGQTWLTDNLIELSKALLFTLKDTHPNTIQSTKPANSRQTLLEIIKKAFPASKIAPPPAAAEAASARADSMETDDESPEASSGTSGKEAAKQEEARGSDAPAGAPDAASTANAAPSSTPANGLEHAAAGDSETKPAPGARQTAESSEQGDRSEERPSGLSASNEQASNSDSRPEESAGEAGEASDEKSGSPPQEPGASSVEPADKAAASSSAANDSAGAPANGAGSSSKSQAQGPPAALHAPSTFQALTKRLSPESSRLIMSFLALITKELANPSADVRETVKACLGILVEVTGCSVTALLLPSRDRLLVPIFGKPLRALPHSMQIGNIDAITYCLSLDPPFLEINDELMRLLSEALALADAEDQALVNHPAQVRSNTVSLTHLRHVCIRMLTAAMNRAELALAKHNTTRARIISVFFKSLYHKSVDVVDAANDGLKQVLLQQQKLPKDLLQAGLRPILLNLSDYKRLTVASLDGLARLLQLLTNYFKVEVGRKLLDHMQQWANPQLLQAASSKPIDDLHEIKILVAILQVFHLLPSSASILLDDLVSSVVNLEVNLCRRESSPFRKPLFMFLNRYPTESVVYFMQRIENSHYARIFAHAIRSPECSPLRDALVAQTPLLVGMLSSFCDLNGSGSSSSSSSSNSENAMAVDSDNPGANGAPPQSTHAAGTAKEPPYKRLSVAMCVMTLVHECMDHNPMWLDTHHDLLQALVETWDTAAGMKTLPDQVQQLAKSALLEHLAHSLLLASRAMANPPAVLFKLLDVGGRSSDLIDTSFVFQYVWDELIVQWPISKRREILSAFMLQLGDASASSESNAILLQRLINPMVATVFSLPAIALSGSKAEEGSGGSPAGASSSQLSKEQRGVELLRGQVISLIHQRVWLALVSSGAHSPPSISGSVRLELVQLSSILIRNAAGVVADLRKDIIKFGWLFIRNDDIMIKNASYVLVAQFISAFDTPPKIINQIYGSLLKAHHVESRALVRQALDILLPVLPVRLGLPGAASSNAGDSAGAGSAELPPWARWAKRILFEQGASLAHTTHVYQLIAGHPALFYPYRVQFAASLVGVLQKMCLTHSATSETRTLALDIMELFLKWHEMQEHNSMGGAEDPHAAAGGAGEAPANDPSSSGRAAPSPDLLMTEARRETIVGLLLRMLCLVFDFALKSNLGPRALDLLSRYLDASVWPPMHLRLTFFERSIQQIEVQGMNQQLVLHILTVLSTVTSHMQPVWFEEYYSNLVAIIRKCAAVENGQVQKIIATLLRQLYEQAAENERLAGSAVVADLRSHVESLVGENLQNNTNIYGTLQILHAIGSHTGEQFYSYIPSLMKYVQKYTKEHNSHAAPASLSATTPASAPLLQQPASSAVASALAGSGHSSTALKPAGADGDLMSLFSANDHVPLTIEAIVRGETSLDILLMLVLLLRDHISRLGDQRRSFLTYIIQLIERSSDPGLLSVILAIVREWVLDPQDVFPTIKEKAMLMSSMMSFVHGSVSANDNSSRASARAAASASAAAAAAAASTVPGSSARAAAANASGPDSGAADPFSLLERKYLTLVLEVYNDPRFTRSEMTMRLEQAFLSGMQSEDSEMRNRFLDTFDANMPPSLPVRLNYLLETQNWESVSSTFWLQQCIPLLLASTHQRASLRSFVANRIARFAKGGCPGAPQSSVSSSGAGEPDSMDVDMETDMDVDMDANEEANGAPDTGPKPSASAPARSVATSDVEMDARGDAADLRSAKDSSTWPSGSEAQVSVGDIVGPLTRMALLDTQFACHTWVALFPLLWQRIGSKEQHDLTSGLIRLLAKPYHQSQTASRPNVIQAILDACCSCTPMPRLPPQLLRYLGQTYGAWYSSLALLEHKILGRREVESAIFDRAMGVELGAFDALTELYMSLSANSYFYGAWKRHCQYKESHVALAYEQLDDWGNAQAAYEQAQTKARAGVLPFSESEYCLWESRWVETTKRLQNWDMLLDLGLHESLPEIELDAGWRVWSWSERQAQVRQLIKATPAEFSSSPRAKFYETYLTLIKGGGERSKTADFQRMCKEGIRLCLQRWNELPSVGTPAHIDVLHMFQLMVELGDASSIYTSLASTKADNLEVKSADLKSVLQTWRERLPNNSDPINLWSDLVAWRQHVFKAINDVYVPFIPQQGGSANEDTSSAQNAEGTPKPGTKNKANAKGAESKGSRKSSGSDGADGSKADGDAKPATPAGGSGATSSVLTSYAYRGYHEMAWIINRFAHVARLHGLVDVCISSLTRIYTLPNIEIQEAFLKLREQAKCYYRRPGELQSGLDVISNTNLMYFSSGQKAEFFTLKGQFLAKLDKLDEANHAFATGIQVDLGSAKAWAAWGRYNDERFCKNLSDTTWAVNAISCYMQAAGLSKRPRVRRYLARTLWLLSQDNASGSVCTAFDNYKSEMPTWYWIAFIPQLLVGLDTPYSRQSLQILLRIAKQYPQALHYSLRTAREESLVARRRQALNPTTPAPGPASGGSNDSPNPQTIAAESTPSTSSTATPGAAPGQQAATLATTIDELMSKLKTAHPLLTLSMESMIDQIVQRLKPFPEEDIYRLIHALLSDGLQQLHARVSQCNFDMGLVDAIVSNTCRVALSLPSGIIKSRFERDFGSVREMDLCTYITRLYRWQHVLRLAIRKRPSKQMLSHFSPFLVEFEQQKFEDVEVPGQYLKLTDNNDEFVRIERFMPELSIVLRSSSVSRNLAIRGIDGSISYFAVQQFTSRHNHQEERWVQLFRNLDSAGEQERDTWEQHRLAFHLPTIVSLAPHIRLVQELPKSFTLQDVYDSACAHSGTSEIAPVLYFVDKMRQLSEQLPGAEEANQALFEQICQRLVPATLLADDIRLNAASPMDYWLYRENFSYQTSVGIALTYIIASTQRTPAKLSISRSNGSVCLSELVPSQATPGLFHSKEPVPFRLTPSIQAFVTELGLEGILPFAIHKVGLRLTEHEYLLRDFLDLYVRDELVHLPNMKALVAATPQALVEMCERNVQLITHRAKQLVETLPPEQVRETGLSPVQPLIQLMMQAVAPSNLSKMDFLWMPWL
ncbi:hypothetical protein GQ54DRAFT_9695 [Martensiomyces pterosporus]|nr:hypothetical protein GQ54DRAFT_9695 [Martensiomyces pterosporus]